MSLVPGRVNTFTYNGPQVSLLLLLAPAEGKYTSVSFRNPGGALQIYRPGDPGGAALVVLPGSSFSIIVSEPVRLTW